jgi:acetyl esterase/lipase
MSQLLRSDLFRFITGTALLAVATLTRIPAPTDLLWKISIAATEGGHWLALSALFPALPRSGQGLLGRVGGYCSLAATVLFVMPLVQAYQLNGDLPSKLQATFGEERRERGRFSEGFRQEPFVAGDMVSSAASRPIRIEERVFSTLEGEKLTLDVFKPGYEHAALPGVLVIHGGSWQGGSSREFLPLNAYLAARDFVVFSINYRLAPKWKFPAGRDDVLSAIAYLKVYAKELGLDPTRLVLLGRSSGGQLALLAAYTANDPSIRGVISVYGPTDLRYGYEHPASKRLIDTRGVLEAYLGGSPSSAEDAYFTASPINFVTPASPPTLLIHGSNDAHVSPEESARLDAKLTQASVKHMFVRLGWATHGCDWSFNGPCGQITTYAIEQFLERVMKGPAPGAKSPQERLAENRNADAKRAKKLITP